MNAFDFGRAKFTDTLDRSSRSGFALFIFEGGGISVVGCRRRRQRNQTSREKRVRSVTSSLSRYYGNRKLAACRSCRPRKRRNRLSTGPSFSSPPSCSHARERANKERRLSKRPRPAFRGEKTTCTQLPSERAECTQGAKTAAAIETEPSESKNCHGAVVAVELDTGEAFEAQRFENCFRRVVRRFVGRLRTKISSGISRQFSVLEGGTKCGINSEFDFKYRSSIVTARR